MCSARRARLTRSIRRMKIGIPPVLRMRARLMVARLFQMRFLGGAGRKPGGFIGFDIAKAAVFVGVGHWLHDTPPIFSVRIMRVFRLRYYGKHEKTSINT